MKQPVFKRRLASEAGRAGDKEALPAMGSAMFPTSTSVKREPAPLYLLAAQHSEFRLRLQVT